MPILYTYKLTVGYKKGNTDYPILSNLNLDLKRGTLVALIGANGIGKSTLLRTIVGNQQPLSGNVVLANIEINKLKKNQLSRLLSIVNTDHTQTGGLTVKELVSLGRHPYTGFLGILDKYDKEIVVKAMQDTGIIHKADCFIAELSDGERQKAMIAKALAQSTPIIILDEPTAFLDAASRMETMLLLHRLAHEQNKAILLSSHDMSQSMILADELWLISHDRKLQSGNTEDIVLSGAMDSVFDSPYIKFNLTHGDFSINIKTTKSINLICEDETLKHWITNALKRNGFAIDDNNQSETTITATTLPGVITITSPQKTTTVNSILELTFALSRIN